MTDQMTTKELYREAYRLMRVGYKYIENEREHRKWEHQIRYIAGSDITNKAFDTMWDAGLSFQGWVARPWLGRALNEKVNA